jgi:hypothetical protein
MPNGTFNPFKSLMEVDRYIGEQERLRRAEAAAEETRGLQNALARISLGQAQQAQLVQPVAMEDKEYLSRIVSAAQTPQEAYGDISAFQREYALPEKQVQPFREQARKEIPERVAKESTERFNKEQKLSAEFRKEVGDYPKVRDAYVRIIESAKNPDAAGDLALIFNYMKVLDPGSTVREGEFANAQNAAGVPDRVRNMFNQVMEGERLGVNQRIKFVNRAKNLYRGQERQYLRSKRSVESKAGRLGLDPRNIVGDLGIATPDLPEQPVVYTEGQTATGPNGERIIFKGGQWQKM